MRPATLQGWLARVVDLYESSLTIAYNAGVTQGAIAASLFWLSIFAALTIYQRNWKHKCVIESP